MSEDLDWAMTALQLEDETEAERWFGAVCDAYQAPEAESPTLDWAIFVHRLDETAERAGFNSEKVNWFTEGLADRASDPLAVLEGMHEYRDELPARYMALVAAAQEGEGNETEEWAKHTPAEWYEYLTQTLGDGWAGWNGSEAEWAGFGEYFLSYAEHAGVRGPAAEFLESINQSEDKVAAFAEYGITIVTEWSKYTPAQWYEHLTQNLGDGWTGWDGLEESWGEFEAWFLSFAEQVGVREPAAQFLQEIRDSGDPIAALAGYGITITPPVAEATAAEPAVETAESEAAEVEAEESEIASAEVQAAVRELRTAVDDLIEEHPELADIPEEQRNAALAEFLQEVAGKAQ